jgi:hypothetical protein
LQLVKPGFRFRDDLHLHGPPGAIGSDISAVLVILEFESDSPLIRAILLDPDPFDGASVKGGFLSFFMKINFPPDELFGFAFLELPPAALPDIFSQFLEIVRLFD